jgi:hypothetical protein
MPKKLDVPPSAAAHRVRNDESRPGFRTNALRRTRCAQARIRDVPEAVPTTLSKADQFAIQLLLDPHVRALEFRTSLSFSGREVQIQMFVADLDEGSRVAFDIIDGRPYRNLDAEGLLLLALESHGIRIIEIDYAAIDAEPRASNTRRLWSYREHRVPAPVRAAVDRALAARQRLTIQSLGSIIGSRDPIQTIGALVSQGVLAIDPSKPLGPNSVIGRRSDRWPSSGQLNWFRKASQ